MASESRPAAWKGGLAPLVLGIVGGLASIWIGGWAFLLLAGYVIGYADPFNARGQRRAR